MESRRSKGLRRPGEAYPWRGSTRSTRGLIFSQTFDRSSAGFAQVRHQAAVKIALYDRRMDVAFAADGSRVAQLFRNLVDRLQNVFPGLGCEVNGSNSRSAIAANTVPDHVRKSFAVNS
jgi:hypothetical protein